MIIKCSECGRRFDDEFRTTICPHETFSANDGANNFMHHPESYLEPDLSNLSHSYPFLGLSRLLGVGYGKVLEVAHRLDSGNIDPDDSRHIEQLAAEEGLPVRMVCLVERVCSAPWRWQFPPQGRGL